MMQSHRADPTTTTAVPQKKEKLEALLRQEETKLLDLLTAVARKSGEPFEPVKEKSKARSTSLFTKERTGSIRPGITSAQRENAYSKSAIAELQGLLDQSLIDIQNLRDEKDREAEVTKATMQQMVNELELMRDRGTAIAHYSNLFISSTLSAIEKGKMTCQESNKLFLIKLAETTANMIKQSGFLEDGDIFHAADSVQAAPHSNRRRSLNMVPFSREDSAATFSSYQDEEDASEQLLAHRLIQMPEALEEVVELLFMEFACMEHSRAGGEAREEKENKFSLSDTYMTKRNFLAMCLVLDLVDSRLTLLAAKSCFEKYAFLSERGQRKFNNRLTINSFVECLMNMAAFKFPDVERDSQEAMQRMMDATDLPELLSNRTLLQGLQDLFIDFCHPGVFDTFAQNQVLLLKAYKRSANYGVRSTFGITTSPESKTISSTGSKGKKPAVKQDVVQSFNQFCTAHKVVPVLTRESVVTRISMYMSSYTGDGVRFFMGCMITLCVALSRSDDDKDMMQFPNIGLINAVLERILLQVEAHM